MRQLAAFEKGKAQLEALGCLTVAAGADTLEQAGDMAKANGLTLPLGYGCTREDGEAIGTWWADYRGGHLQPAEFVLGRGGAVLASMYASGPVGRMGVDEVIRFLQGRERRRLEQERQPPRQ